jgi:small-conductance mechanosensitive channel
MIGGQGSPASTPAAAIPDPSDVALVAAGLSATAQPGHDDGARVERTDLIRKLAEARETLHRPDFRRAVVAGIVALSAPAVDYWLGGVHAHRIGYRLGSLSAVFACLLFGVMAVRSAAAETARITLRRGGPAVAGTLRLLIIVVGYILVAVTVLGLLDVPLDRLLLSGAITGVVVGIAAQQSLGNAFAGLVLLFSRPFAVGDYIVLRSGALGGPYDGEVIAITLMYTILETPEGPITIPNSGVMASATGLRERPKPADDEVE